MKFRIALIAPLALLFSEVGFCVDYSKMTNEQINKMFCNDERIDYDKLSKEQLSAIYNGHCVRPVCESTKAYYKCLLNELPGTENDIAAGSIIRKCQEENPCKSSKQNVKAIQIFGKTSSSSCVATHGKNTRSSGALGYITQACYALYGD